MDLSVLEQMFGQYWPYIFSVIGAASIISAFVPAPKEDSGIVYKTLYKILQWCSVNVYMAKNESDKSTSKSKDTEVK